MKEVTTKIYRLSELTEEVREEVIDRVRYSEQYNEEVNYNLSEIVEDIINGDFPESELKLQYSLYQQGSGFNLYGDLHIEDVPTLTAEEKNLILEHCGETINLKVNNIYSYNVNDYYEILNNFAYDNSENDEKIEEIAEKIAKFIEEKTDSYYNIVKFNYDEVYCDDGIIDFIESNEMEFTEYGK